MLCAYIILDFVFRSLLAARAFRNLNASDVSRIVRPQMREGHLPARAALGGVQEELLPAVVDISPPEIIFGPSGVDFCNLLRAPFPRRWGHTVPTIFSTPGPAECAQRLNKEINVQSIQNMIGSRV